MAKLSKSEVKVVIENVGPEKQKEIEELNNITFNSDGTISTAPNPQLRPVTTPQSIINDSPCIDPGRGDLVGSVVEPEASIALSEKNKEEIVQLHSDIQNYLNRSLQNAVRIGELLFNQKQLLKHGEFTSWVKKNLPFQPRTAQNYMKLYSFKDQLAKKNVNTITEAYSLINWEVLNPEFIVDADDSIKTKEFCFSSESSINLDKLPKPIAVGIETKARVTGNILNEMKNPNSCFNQWKGRYTKFVVEMPDSISNCMLYGEFVQLAAGLLREGGKIIFHKPKY